MNPQIPNDFPGSAAEAPGTRPPGPLLEESDSQGSASRVGAMPCCGGAATEWRPLNRKQRIARLLVGLGFLLWAISQPWSSVASILVVALLAWFGVSHVLAAAMAYPGCPELGAVASLLLRRSLKIACGPWQWFDKCLGLTSKDEDATASEANHRSPTHP